MFAQSIAEIDRKVYGSVRPSFPGSLAWRNKLFLPFILSQVGEASVVPYLKCIGGNIETQKTLLSGTPQVPRSLGSHLFVSTSQNFPMIFAASCPKFFSWNRDSLRGIGLLHLGQNWQFKVFFLM